jgi:ankyrin repeat protein
MKRLIALIVVISFVISSGMLSAAQPRRQRGCCSISRVLTGLALGMAALKAYQVCTAPDDISKLALRGDVDHEYSLTKKADDDCRDFYYDTIGSPHAPESIHNMLKCGQDIDTVNSHGETLLHRAVEHNDAVSVAALLHHGANPNRQNYPFKQTPLHYAAIYDNPTILLALIKAGANVNARDQYGETPLHYAAGSASVDIIQALINNGADMDVCDKDGRTPVRIALGRDSRGPVAAALVNNGAPFDCARQHYEFCCSGMLDD